MEKRNYLQVSNAHDSRHFDFRSNCLLIMCSVYLNRGLTINFVVFKGFPVRICLLHVYMVYFREICVFVFIEYVNEVIFSKGIYISKKLNS